MRTRTIVFLIVTIALISTYATDFNESEFPKFMQGLGVAAGHYSGVGMSYKAIFNGRYGIQLTASYYSEEDYSDYGDYRWAMPGIELQYHLTRHKNTSFYISTGLSYEYIRDEYYYWLEEPVDNWYYETRYEDEHIWTTGAGFGMEAILFDRISATAEAIMYYRDNGRASIMVQGSLHYYFNLDRSRNKDEGKDKIKSQTSE